MGLIRLADSRKYDPSCTWVDPIITSLSRNSADVRPFVCFILRQGFGVSTECGGNKVPDMIHQQLRLMHGLRIPAWPQYPEAQHCLYQRPDFRFLVPCMIANRLHALNALNALGRLPCVRGLRDPSDMAPDAVTGPWRLRLSSSRKGGLEDKITRWRAPTHFYYLTSDIYPCVFT